MVDSALVFHLKDVYRERLTNLLRDGADLIDVAAELSETDTEKATREIKLRNLLGAALMLRRIMGQFCEVNNLEEVMDEDLTAFAFLQLAPGNLNFAEREVVFRRYVQALVNAKLVDEEASSINELGEFFELEPFLVQSVVRSCVGPIYEARVRACVDKNDLSESSKTELQRIIKDFRVAESEVRYCASHPFSPLFKLGALTQEICSESRFRQVTDSHSGTLTPFSGALDRAEPVRGEGQEVVRRQEELQCRRVGAPGQASRLPLFVGC